MTLYRDIANKITRSIDKGIYLPGTRLPGVRRLSEQFGVSVSTIVQAQRQLENRGLVEARPRSGYYVNSVQWKKPPLPQQSRPQLKPTPVTGQEMVLQLARLANRDDFIHLGAAIADPSFLPIDAFQRSLNKVTRLHKYAIANYTFPPGLPALQDQLVKRMNMYGSDVSSDQVLVTNGCQEAISLALQTVAKPGDIVAIESPTFYGLLQVIESLGMKALEIPTDPKSGMSLSALELALDQWDVKACVLTPNFSNPLGGVMPDHKKQQLVELTQKHHVMLIEDDIYGDLNFTGRRPRSLHSFSDSRLGNVVYCSSFSKTISQGLRVGWMVLPERFFAQAEYLKYVTNLAAPSLAQFALADFLEQGGYERFLRQVRARYRQQVDVFTHAVSKYFPEHTRVTQPEGGFVLWLELAGDVDMHDISQQMLEHKVSIAPGRIFSASQKYGNCLRLNCAQVWSPALEKALIELGRKVSG